MEIVHFQKRGVSQNSDIFVRNGKLKKRLPWFHQFSSKIWSNSKQEFGWPCRVGSAVCFFVLILNNAPALRAGNHHQSEICIFDFESWDWSNQSHQSHLSEVQHFRFESWDSSQSFHIVSRYGWFSAKCKPRNFTLLRPKTDSSHEARAALRSTKANGRLGVSRGGYAMLPQASEIVFSG